MKRKYSPALLERICVRLEAGETLASICRSDGMPGVQTVSDWMRADESVSVRIAHARDIGFDAIAQQALDIAHDTSRDTVMDEKGHERMDSEWVQRSKLRVDTLLRLLAKWCPQRYGEQLKVEHSGKVEAVIGGENA